MKQGKMQRKQKFIAHGDVRLDYPATTDHLHGNACLLKNIARELCLSAVVFRESNRVYHVDE